MARFDPLFRALMRALIFNLSMAAGLLLMFIGAWMVFGLGPALLAAGWMIWATTLIATRIAAVARVAG